MRTTVVDWLIVNALRLNTLTTVLIGAGVWMLSYQTWLGFNTEHTDATVVRIEQQAPELRGPVHVPRVFLRVKRDGRRVECTDTSLHWRWMHYAAGDIVPILFYPSQPRPECTIDSFSRRWLLGIVLLLCGFALLSILGNVWVRRHGSPELE